jgi:hypothetical protein
LGDRVRDMAAGAVASDGDYQLRARVDCAFGERLLVAGA